MILKEEFSEALDGSNIYGIRALISFVATVSIAAVRFHPDYAASAMSWNAALVGAALLTLVCYVNLMRCRRTVRAWRNQKRLEMIQDEVRQDTGS